MGFLSQSVGFDSKQKKLERRKTMPAAIVVIAVVFVVGIFVGIALVSPDAVFEKFKDIVQK